MQSEEFVGLHPSNISHILNDIVAEVGAQLQKWGDQHHPIGTGSSVQSMEAEYYRARCKAAAADGSITWEHILQEEIAEAFAESNFSLLRNELVQSAAVIVSMIRDIERSMA